MNGYTDLLYARPSLLEGVARILDLAGTLNQYNDALTPEQADHLALWSDWRAIGMDLWAAAEQPDGESSGNDGR